MPAERRTILVVDDDEDIRTTLCELLADEGFETLAAGDGQQALDVMRSGVAIDLVLLDMMMPRKDGWATRAEQVADPAIAAIPVIVLSASVASAAELAGVKCILQKPISFGDLMARVLQHI